MDKEQARTEYKKIIQENVGKTIFVMEEAKKNGTWKMGLDTNKELFWEIDDDAKRKIALLQDALKG